MNKKLNYFSTIKFLSKYILAYKKNYIMFAIGWLFDILLKLFTPIMFAVMIDEIVYYQNVSVYLRISVALVTMILFACIVHFFTQQQYAYLQIMYSFEIKNDLFNAIQQAKAEALTDMQTGDILNTLQSHTFECMVFVIRNIIHTVNNLLALTFYIIYVFVIGWKFGVLMLVGVPISVYATIKFGKITRKCSDEYNTVYGKYSGWLMEHLSALRDLRLLGAQKVEEEKFVGFQRKLFKKENQNSVITLSSQSVVQTINFLVQMAVYALCAFYACRGEITIGVLTIILNYFVNIKDKVMFFSTCFVEAQRRISRIQRVYDLFNLPSEKEWKGKDKLCVTSGKVEFKQITFGYADKQSLFNQFSLDIEGGRKIALVGKSGSGKTTLAYMLTGFYQPTEGEILIDGKDISECSLKSIRENVGIVQQDVLVFDGTIRSNLLFGKRDATEEEILEACERAGLGEFIRSLKDGIDTVVGSKGVGLSGGQRQRIAIARIYLKNPQIILFDEATSALDSETEAFIHDSWEKALVGRTAIVISHRLSSVMMCEKVALIEDGVLKEYGETKKLLESSEELRTLFAIS
ncbi:MAG: ABC transporter ATP-binding protein [Lachnospiraceae bacterium]|nr:ABC transporter ATP-binding protein [Lachnospiraceae bacterium]